MAEEKAKKEKKAVTKTVYLQYAGREVSIDEAEASIMENYDSVKMGEDPPYDIKIYLKPEDYKAYYVINDDYAGEVELLID